MQRAWRENRLAYNSAQVKTNAHRLLLFYAVECGLKAIYMLRNLGQCTNDCTDLYRDGHNINRLLDLLNNGNDLKLHGIICMSDIIDNQSNTISRRLKPGQINQMWRYGGKLEKWGNESQQQRSTDEDLEAKLLNICEFIEQEINR
ncbi:hypothetical protein PA905_23700 [Planktothrix agardhii CCAP 1459/11A]|uniref:HEPN domain-containing protein n=2 Tax=Planktothrix agardhii TaxID=1160 RepID=A0A4P5ZWE9_PLAAG|nr:hypothetical protein PA905_23700 [Planktothrix agardhii CCAP 1459/11A]